MGPEKVDEFPEGVVDRLSEGPERGAPVKDGEYDDAPVNIREELLEGKAGPLWDPDTGTDVG